MLMEAYLNTPWIHQRAHLQTVCIFCFLIVIFPLKMIFSQIWFHWERKKKKKQRRDWNANLGEINQGNEPQEWKSECALHLFDPCYHFFLLLSLSRIEEKGEEKENPNHQIWLNGVWFGAWSDLVQLQGGFNILSWKNNVSLTCISSVSGDAARFWLVFDAFLMFFWPLFDYLIWRDWVRICRGSKRRLKRRAHIRAWGVCGSVSYKNESREWYN